VQRSISLNPEFAVALEQSKLYKCGLGGWIDIERTAETESAVIRHTSGYAQLLSCESCTQLAHSALIKAEVLHGPSLPCGVSGRVSRTGGPKGHRLALLF
jgi:hypothetical protein